MRNLRALWLRMSGVFQQREAAGEFEAELADHVARHTADGVRAGLSEPEARRRALIRLGGAEQARQAYRERATLPWIEDFVHDLRFGLRMMARDRAFTGVAVLTLAIGMAASATSFTWINAVLLHPMAGAADPERLVALDSVTPNGEIVPNSYPDFIDFRDHLKLFEGVAVSRPNAFTIGLEDHAERVWGELVSGNYFSVLGVKPEAGRVFLPAEFADAPGKFPIVVISDRYWRAHYAANPAVIGQTLRVNQHELTIVGVAPPDFHGSLPAIAYDLWTPYMEQAVLNGVPEWMLRNRQNRNMLGFARLNRGVTTEQAGAELAGLARRLAAQHSDVSEGMSAIVMPLWKSPFGPQGQLLGPLRILSCVSLLVLLIVCANVANLQLARATARESEFGARLALGARRTRIVRQVLTESLILAFSGAALGVASAPLLARSLHYLLPRGAGVPVVTDTRPNLAVIAFSALICVFAAIAAGLAPALQVGRISLSSRMNAGGRSGSTGSRRNRLRSVLVSCEVALALVALVAAALFARSFQATLQIDPGFDPNHVLLNQFYLNTNGYSLQQRKEFCERLAERMLAAPGVTGVAYSDIVPLGFEPSWWEDLRIEGYSPQPAENMKIFRNVISAGYLPLMHIPLVEGRNFTEQDGDSDKAPLVMIVNETFVHRFFAGRDPIGKRVHGWGQWFRVVGVAKDAKYHFLGESTPPYFYVPFRQVYRADMNLGFYVRTHGDPESILPTLRAQVRALDPNVTVYDPVPLREFIGASLFPQKIAASLMAVLGGLAVLLAAAGLYSVMAYWVAQRTREIGVRMALGAQPRHLRLMVVRQGLSLAAGGLIAGIILAFAFSRGVASLSFTNSAMGSSVKLMGASASNPLLYLAAAAFLSLLAAVAAYVPARRAASIDPMQALRSE